MVVHAYNSSTQVAQLVGSLPSLQEALGPIPSKRKTSVVVHAYNPRIQELEVILGYIESARLAWAT